MENVILGKKTYAVDDGGFLLDYDQWDDAFAEGMAPSLGIPKLTSEHWNIIRFIRSSFEQNGRCPLVFETCRAHGLHLSNLKRLFPAGYLRGACKLAGITYAEGCFVPGLVPIGDYTAGPAVDEKSRSRISPSRDKIYAVDVRGFLVNPDDWDEQYALFKAYEMRIPAALTNKHWEVIHFLRNSFKKNGVVPTVYETCEANNVELEDLERLFPPGYHRGAVKIAGLRVR
ncbi:MAG: TusE/DsrC/DsvC family sulfur relay protein [Candidatus Abyssobacteria bacterium SURF_17]|jgi:tRNA 2-thiouridine synthesizing protein E|uniref:TusE/DsrC/DsvC family sulfur relay protein n=1 Tax=Candidatus Abyssobacteria bacterium SURF_17 TaxID=2093361 RepID=A0A419ES94_9BACT|nr:MAG: TusE/DsrC/DsvC family sulfur relay protein [Candidatus Abyssubacteria bacterium SURF_17]